MRSMMIVLVALLLFACNNETGTVVKSGQQTLIDSLVMDVNKGHNLGMARMGKLTRYQQSTQQLRDSIAALPAAARTRMDGYLRQLDTLQRQIDSADLSMNKWMEEYSFDTLADNPELKATYLSGEKIKVEAMVGLIQQAISKGDSLLRIVRPGAN